jgi:hypothetical protein
VEETIFFGGLRGKVFSQPGGFINTIHMFDPMNGVAQGDPVAGKWTVLRTRDGRATWSHFPNEPLQFENDHGLTNSLAALDSMHIWFGTDSSRIYRTTDGGASWTRHVVSPRPHVWCINFLDATCGVAGTSELYRTTDGGLTWYPAHPPLSSFAPIVSLGITDFWIVSDFQQVYHSSDRGETWSFSFAAPACLNGIDFHETPTEVAGWVVGNSGFIARYHDVLTSTDRRDATLPSSAALEQNYPNPFNPSTTIRYGLPQNSAVQLKVYSTLGQEVATLMNETKPAGVYTEQFAARLPGGQAGRVASGVYFYRLSTNNFVQTRKIVVLR